MKKLNGVIFLWPLVIFGHMKASLLTLTALCGLNFYSNAQALEVYPAQVSFGYVNELSEDSVEITFYNNSPSAFDIEVAEWFKPYDDDAFELSPSVVNISGLDSAKAWVKFHPKQNIDFSGNIVFADKGAGGAVVLEVDGHGRFSNSYYNSTEGLSEEALKTALNTRLAQGFVSLSYDNARDQMYGSIDNVNGDVECVYTGRVATFSTRAGANANSFNCEHTFPQGFFNQAQPMRGDIHHLFPTDASVNSRRSNHPFGVVTNPTWTGGGSKYGSSVFEPRDAHKGAAARAMLYFVIRYQDYTNFFAPQEAILRQWHQTYAPSAFEIGRNNDIYALQNNRNPFVDYPQLEKRINNFVTNSTVDPVFELTLAHDTIFAPQSNSASHRVTFRTAVLNTGNQVVFLTGQAFTDTTIHYENSTNGAVNLQPGEAREIEISYPYNKQFTSGGISLVLTTSMPSGNVEIPIQSELFELSNEEFSAPTSKVYPNPASEVIHLPEHAKHVRIFDISGKEVYFGETSNIELVGFEAGTYLVKYFLEDILLQETFVVQPK